MNKTIPAGNQHLNRVLLIDVVIIDKTKLNVYMILPYTFQLANIYS